MAKVNQKCPIWGTAATLESADGPSTVVDSPRAGGKYRISGSLAAAGPEIQLPDGNAGKARLTSWLVEQKMIGDPVPLITRKVLDTVRVRKPLTVPERANRILEYLAILFPLGATFYSNSLLDPAQGILDKLLAWSGSPHLESCSARHETEMLLGYLLRLGYLNEIERLDERGQRAPDGSQGARFLIRPEGFAHLEEMQHTHVPSSQAFVAMWFDSSMDDAYDKGVKAAITDAGYKPRRIDEKAFSGKIDDEIIAEIRRSRFLVADFTQGETGARGGVYYEAGFAHGLGIPVIFTCHEDAADALHFDTRQYNHILWDTSEHLREKLAKRISATLGDGPETAPTPPDSART